MRLLWHSYKYYPYERELARREVTSLLSPEDLNEGDVGINLVRAGKLNGQAKRLVYFSKAIDGNATVDTTQALLEGAVSSQNRQATRYSTHGLHEYKGKFNPQVAKAVLNIFHIKAGDRVLDPFCGSGTTLVECAHVGAKGYGTDLNPFAVFLAKAKLFALVTPANELKGAITAVATNLDRQKAKQPKPESLRLAYLREWFIPEILDEIEALKVSIETYAGSAVSILLACASNLLRDYSLQEPSDLRIRRRKSPLPSKPFTEAFFEAAHSFVSRVRDAQEILGSEIASGTAIVCDAGAISQAYPSTLFDAAITSPPYAMALPYIDTQRLSLVWLGLIDPKVIMPLEASLTGSRELRAGVRQELHCRLRQNLDCLPLPQARFCLELQEALAPTDGFRRRAVPILLYRYFVEMRNSFAAVRSKMKPNAPYALIVGHNHTVLGGVRRDIDTPTHLMQLAVSVGWEISEILPLQTFRRFGLHSANSIEAETMVVLRNTTTRG